MSAVQSFDWVRNALARADSYPLNEAFLPVVTARDRCTLDSEIQSFISETGFERYGVAVIHDDFSSADSCVILGGLNNTPPEYLAEWANVEAGRRDPVMQLCKRALAPILYGPDTYARADAMEMWERQAPFGYAHGVGSTFHLPQNLHVYFGVDRRTALPANRAELVELVARIHLFGTFVQCAALSLLGSSIPHGQAKSIRLSPREYECLKWAAEGKTAWETGMLLSIAEATVAKILASALRKLDCATKPQAVVKALRLGLIH